MGDPCGDLSHGWIPARPGARVAPGGRKPGFPASVQRLDRLEGEVDFAALRAAKLVPSNAKRAKIVKRGEISKKLLLKGVLATAGARAAIEAAGGQVQDEAAE